MALRIRGRLYMNENNNKNKENNKRLKKNKWSILLPSFYLAPGQQPYGRRSRFLFIFFSFYFFFFPFSFSYFAFISILSYLILSYLVLFSSLSLFLVSFALSLASCNVQERANDLYKPQTISRLDYTQTHRRREPESEERSWTGRIHRGFWPKLKANDDGWGAQGTEIAGPNIL